MIIKKIKISKLTIIALCLIIIAGIIFYYEEIKAVNYEIETVNVVVATKCINENTIITSDMIKMDNRYKIDISKQTDTILTYAEAIGKRTKVPLYEGEVVSKNRVVNNQPYMNDELNETQISLCLNENDKAIAVVGGDYIDIWKEPKSIKNENETNVDIIEAEKIFEKLCVVNVYNESYQTKNSEEFVPAFIVIQLDDNKLKQYLDIDKSIYEIRITKYGEEQLYNAINKK